MVPWLLLLPLALGGAPAPQPAPDAPGSVQPTRWWDVQHLRLAVDIDIDGKSLVGRTTHHIQPLARESSRLRLHQAGLDIRSVTVDGQPTTYVVGQEWIDIAVVPGKPHEVTVDYTAQPELGLHFRRPGRDSARYLEAWSQGEDEDHRHWFPSWDYPNDRFTLEIDVTVPSDLVVVANGALVGTDDAGQGRSTWHYKLEQPVVNYLVSVTAGQYRKLDLEGGRVPFETYVGQDLPESSGRLGLDQAVPMLAYFDRTLGTDYPYSVYRQVGVQTFMYGGMENASTTTLAERLLVIDSWDDPRRAESVVAHELAHQWFGDLLTCYGWRELWLNEGFATYWTQRWMEEAYGEAYAASRWAGTWRGGQRQPHPMALRAWSRRQDDPPNHNVYSHGASVLHMLEVHLGREVFDAGIRAYVADNQGRLVETDDLRRAMEDASGEHLGWLFDQWVHRPGVPKFQVRHRFEPGTDGAPGQIVVIIDQPKPEDGGPAWRAPVRIEVGTPQGVKHRTAWLGAGETQIVIDSDDAPAWVLADPDHGVLAQWQQDLTAEQWRAMLADSPSWHARLTAVKALATTDGGQQDVDALSAFASDSSLDRAVRQVAVASLGKRTGGPGVQALATLATDDDPRIRTAVAEALTPHPADEDVLDLLQALRRDPFPPARAAALTALAKVDSQAGLKAASAALRGESPEVVAALTVLGDHGEPKVLRQLLPSLQDREPRPVRQSGAYALWRLVARHPDEERMRETVSRAVEPMLDSDDVRIRSLAIRVLGGMGDDPAARRLQAFANQTKVAEHRERARDAAKDIRTRAEEPSKKPDKDDLDRLRERIDSLQEQVEDLERRQ